MFKNCLTHKKETIKHFLYKCAVYKILVEKGNDAKMEFDTHGHGVVDVFDRTEGIAYEIESNPTKDKSTQKLFEYKLYAEIKDVVIIPIQRPEIFGPQLIEYLKTFIN